MVLEMDPNWISGKFVAIRNLSALTNHELMAFSLLTNLLVYLAFKRKPLNPSLALLSKITETFPLMFLYNPYKFGEIWVSGI